jgi:hypothetical protein
MAKALECPACGARHSLDTIPEARTFRCDRCGQVLKVPESLDAERVVPRPPSAAGAATTPSATTPSGAPPTPAPGAPVPPPRRGGSAATGPRVSATASASTAATAAAATSAGSGEGSRDRSQKRAARGDATPRRRVHWYWRILAWVVAVPLGLLITGWPALQLDLINKDDLLDVFVGEGSGRYVRLLVFAAAWALVTALLVQLLVEGGRWWSQRRRPRAGTRTPVPV